MAIGFLNSNLLNTDLNMYHCGMEDCSHGHFFGPAVRDHFLIHYIVKGKGSFQVGDIIYNLEAGQGFLICPNIVTYYQADSEDPWSYRWVGFQGLKAESYLKKANLSLYNPIFKYNSDNSLINCLDDMVNANLLMKNSDIRLLSLLYNFIAILVENNPEDNYIRHNIDKREVYVQKAVEYIEKNYSRKISIQEISKSINLDRSYFGSIFKDYFNKSPQEFLIHFRFNKACDLMKNKSLSIADISRSVGYDDPLLFSKLFKKFKGLSPNKYRNTI
jgi:AraC-like DNA-binding protein